MDARPVTVAPLIEIDLIFELARHLERRSGFRLRVRHSRLRKLPPPPFPRRLGRGSGRNRPRRHKRLGRLLPRRSRPPKGKDRRALTDRVVGAKGDTIVPVVPVFAVFLLAVLYVLIVVIIIVAADAIDVKVD